MQVTKDMTIGELLMMDGTRHGYRQTAERH